MTGYEPIGADKSFMEGFVSAVDKDRVLYEDANPWYSLVGYWEPVADGDRDGWQLHLMPLPVFFGLAFPQWAGEWAIQADGKRYPAAWWNKDFGRNAQNVFLAVYTVETRHRSQVAWDRSQGVLDLEFFSPIKDGRGLIRMEDARRGFGCAVTVDSTRMEEIILLPWDEQVVAYMVATQEAYDKYVATTDDEEICPQLPTEEDGAVVYTTSTGNTHLVARDGTFQASRLDGTALSVVYPDLYEASGGQPYPGYRQR